MGLYLARIEDMPNSGIERRRDSVSREEFDNLVDAVSENTELTKDIRGLLLSFKVMMHIGKWVSVIATMIVAVAAAYHALWNPPA